ncbi:MAG TPA: hypothetical protein DHW40_06045 [Microbacterium sp.]|nr:hypothetical protein [Microbacterium sp.]
MSRKINLIELARAQLATFRGYSLPVRVRDFSTFILLPIALGVLAWFFAPPVYNVAGLLTGASVFAGLLVALLVNVFNFSVKIRRDEKIRPEERLARTVDELMANAAWTVVSALALVVVMATVTAAQAPQCPIDSRWVGLLVALAAYVVLNVLMVLSRIWTAHGDIKDLPPKR